LLKVTLNTITLTPTMCKDQSENLQIIDNGIYILKTNSCKTSFIPIPSLLGGHGSDHMVVGFTATCAISAYHQFLSDLR
jgi:hypothetical protein